jgi:hypothetical protein
MAVFTRRNAGKKPVARIYNGRQVKTVEGTKAVKDAQAGSSKEEKKNS